VASLESAKTIRAYSRTSSHTRTHHSLQNVASLAASSTDFPCKRVTSLLPFTAASFPSIGIPGALSLNVL